MDDQEREQAERRSIERRADDRHQHQIVIAALTLAVGVGVAWGTATAVLATKVDKADQWRVDAIQDAKIQLTAGRQDDLKQALTRLQSSIDSVNVRLRQIVCDGRPSSCR